MERKETDIIPGTDTNLVGEVEQQYYDVLKILIDPELEGLKSRIQVLVASMLDFICEPDRTTGRRRKKRNQVQNQQGGNRSLPCQNIHQQQNHRRRTAKS